MHNGMEADLSSSHVLITGANGFVGRELTRQLLSRGCKVTGAVRNILDVPEFQGAAYSQSKIDEDISVQGWKTLLQGVDVIFHLAARVHQMKESSSDALLKYRKENATNTEVITKAAVGAGVKRLVFLSSIKVNGEGTSGNPYREEDTPKPKDPYAISKHEAEQAILSNKKGMEIVIFRSSLIYGCGVKANFLKLIRWVDQGIPLPFASVNNKRSMVYLGNLVDALILSATHPSVIDNTYLLSDGVCMSTPDIIREISTALGKKANLWPFPSSLLSILARMAGKKGEIERLIGSLQVDSSKFCKDTGWVPPYTFSQGINKTVEWYRGEFK